MLKLLYHWLYQFSDQISFFNIFRYISFRSFLSFYTSFLICWWAGPFFIQKLKDKQLSQKIRNDGPDSHKKKEGTPTMGGCLILLSILVAALLWVDIMNPLLWAVLLITFGFSTIGYWDDKLKISNKSSKGLPGLMRLFLETVLAAFVILALLVFGYLSPEVHIPFLKDVSFDLGWFYILFGSLVIVGCANAVNLTDGLDGLAIVPVIVCAATFILFSYVSGHSEMASYLSIPFIPSAGELAPLSAGVVAAGLGFLWFNSYPAQVFMGDIGSLGLGGFLGVMAVLTKNELLMLVLGGVFVFEAMSVMLQVFSYKMTGKRVFKMAPLHHHYELKGLVENKIIVRFWIVSILLAVLSLSTLKIR